MWPTIFYGSSTGQLKQEMLRRFEEKLDPWMLQFDVFRSDLSRYDTNTPIIQHACWLVMYQMGKKTELISAEWESQTGNSTAATVINIATIRLAKQIGLIRRPGARGPKAKT
jgi:hypothetical protein